MTPILQLGLPLEWKEVNGELVKRLLIDLSAVLILIRFIYFKYQKKSALFFTFAVFNLIIFFVAYLLNKVEMTTGAAFGLFAVFSILRYRTEGIAAIDMTYLFLSIAIGLISAVSKGHWIEISIICGLILSTTLLMESNVFQKREHCMKIHYDHANLIHQELQAELLQDLQKRTGLPIHRFEILDIDFLKDTCHLNAYYHEA